jgi:hypothetical protein
MGNHLQIDDMPAFFRRPPSVRILGFEAFLLQSTFSSRPEKVNTNPLETQTALLHRQQRKWKSGCLADKLSPCQEAMTNHYLRSG